MGKASPPPPPDYRGAAEETAKSNKEAAEQQMYYNRPDQFTPFGSQEWSYDTTTDPTTGRDITTSTQTSKLDPLAQEALDSQLRVQAARSGFGENMIGRVGEGYQEDFDFGQYGDYQQLSTDPNTVRQEAYDNMAQMGAPQREQDRARMETQLANQGITQGSQAYENAMRQLGDQESRQEMGWQQNAGAEGQRMQGMDIANANTANNIRQMQLSEGLLERQSPLNEMNALLTGQQVSQPNMPGFKGAQNAGGTDYSGAMAASSQHEMDIFNAEQASKDAMMSGLMNMGSSAAMMCDLRVKRNLELVGHYDDGIPQYAFQYLWSDEWFLGPVAQEVEQVRPELVFEHEGVKHVNMRGLGYAS